MNRQEVLESFFSTVNSLCAAALPPETLREVRAALAEEETALRIICTIQKGKSGRIVGALYRSDKEPELLFDISPREGDT